MICPQKTPLHGWAEVDNVRPLVIDLLSEESSCMEMEGSGMKPVVIERSPLDNDQMIIMELSLPSVMELKMLMP